MDALPRVGARGGAEAREELRERAADAGEGVARPAAEARVPRRRARAAAAEASRSSQAPAGRREEAEVIDLSSPLVGGGMALSASALWAASTTVFKAPIVRDGPRAMNLFRVAIAFLLFWGITLALDGAAGFALLATHAGGLLVLSGALGLALGDFFLFYSVKEIGAQPAVTLNLLSPVWSAALGALLGSEHLRWQQFGAIALVIGGVVVVIRSKASGDLESSADELPVIDDAATRRHAAHGRHGLG